jgi:nifR3 family TIM-barrel protein
MQVGFGNLKKPIFLAPMEDVTDYPFRNLCKSYGVDVLVSEFVSSDALVRNVKRNFEKMHFDDRERPVGIQIYGHDTTTMVEAAKIVETFHPDFIDINAGCPVKKVVRRGAGAGLLQDVPKLLDLVKQVVDAVSLPVSVKMRLGWDAQSIVVEEVVEGLQQLGVQFVTIHGRTRSQIYSGEANCEIITNLSNRNDIAIPIVGNGDIDSPEKAKQCFEKGSLGGIMVGRGAIGNPWLFAQIKHYLATGELLSPPSIDEKVEVAIRHLEATASYYSERVAPKLMRRHYVRYFKGLSHFKEFKLSLLRSDSVEENKQILKTIAKTYCQ